MARTAEQVARLKARIAAIPPDARAQIGKALLKSGNELADAMQRVVPVDTGELKASITVTAPGQATPAYSQPGGSHSVHGLAVAVTAGNAKVRYAHLVEFGTSDTPAKPYFWPMYRLHKRRIKNRIARAVRAAVKKTVAEQE